ncbi:MAG: type II secretion system F family protein [bacterium]
MEKSEKSLGIVAEICLIPVLIFKYFFSGVQFVTVDTVKAIKAAFVEPPEVQLTNSGETIRSNVSEYNKYKNIRKKKVKKYNYSNKVLKQLEEEKKNFLEDLQKEGGIRLEKPVIYLFKVRDEKGKIIKGTMHGLSKLDVNAFLLNEGHDVYSIQTSKWINFAYNDASVFGTSKMNSKELIFFLTQLTTYLKAGLTLSNSMNILSKQVSKNASKSRIFQAISFELSLGENFSTALEKQNDMFPALLINMIKAAEASGTLTETLDDMVEYYENINTTKKQMTSAIAYPTVILSFAVVVIAFIMIYVIPQFTDIYAAQGSEITGLTAFIMSASDFLQANIINMVLTVIVFIITIIVLYKKVKAFRTVFQIMLMNTYVIKDVIIYNEITIFTKTFASLLRNNVYITDSVDILSKITNNEIYKGILFQTIDNIVRGEKISEAFEGHWAVPDIAYHMMVTGESTGDLANMMQKVSDYYQEMHKGVVSNLKALVEPILTGFLAIIVGIIIIAVIVPMYGSLNELTS